MKTIIDTPGEPFMIEDRTTPVYLVGHPGHPQNRLWLSLHEAMSVTGEDVHDIVASAEAKVPTQKGNQFHYPDRPTLRQYLPSYRFIRNQPHLPVPVSVTLEIRQGRRVHREDWHYRTLTAFRQVHALTVRQSEIILARAAGWKTLLPQIMIGATRHTAGWVPPGGWSAALGGRMAGPLFRFTLTPTWITVRYLGVTRGKKISDFPEVVVANSSY